MSDLPDRQTGSDHLDVLDERPRRQPRAVSPRHQLSLAAAVRAAYLDALPWGTPDQRAHALDLGLRLLPVKKAHGYIRRDRAIGRATGNRHLAAVLTRAVREWEAGPPAGAPA